LTRAKSVLCICLLLAGFMAAIATVTVGNVTISTVTNVTVTVGTVTAAANDIMDACADTAAVSGRQAAAVTVRKTRCCP